MLNFGKTGNIMISGSERLSQSYQTYNDIIDRVLSVQEKKHA